MDAVNAATTVQEVATALANYAPYTSLIAADKGTAQTGVLGLVQTSPVTAASLANYFNTNFALGLNSATYTAATPADPGAQATAAVANVLTVTAENAGTELNGVEIEFVDNKNNQAIETTLTPATSTQAAKLTIELANVSANDGTITTTLANIKDAIEDELDVTVALDANVNATDLAVVTAAFAFSGGQAAAAATADQLELTFTHNVTLGSSVTIDIAGTDVTATRATIKAGTDNNVVVLTLPANTTVNNGTAITVENGKGISVDGYVIPVAGLTVNSN